METTTMARPKAGAKAPKAGPKGGSRAGFRTLGFRVSNEYAEWLEHAAKHNRVSVAALLDKAAVAYAEATGFAEPPPERLP